MVPIILLVCVLLVGVLGMAAILKVIREELQERRLIRQRIAAQQARAAETRRLQAEHAAQLAKQAQRSAPPAVAISSVLSALEQSGPVRMPLPQPPTRTAHGTTAPPMRTPIVARGTPPPLASPRPHAVMPAPVRTAPSPPPRPRGSVTLPPPRRR